MQTIPVTRTLLLVLFTWLVVVDADDVSIFDSRFGHLVSGPCGTHSFHPQSFLDYFTLLHLQLSSGTVPFFVMAEKAQCSWAMR